MDPRGHEKVCQDLVFLESYKDVTLAGVMDGHGPKGELVVAFCKQFAFSYLRRKESCMERDPQRFLIDMTEECDKSLKADESPVDSMCSGCTAVFILYKDNTFYFASVGDSRAILATTHPPDVLAATQPPRGEDKALLAEIKIRRSVQSSIELTAVQMTVDQKPEDPKELLRIQQSGGVVMRLEDDSGKRLGPYRVWKVENMYPGIAMSRSLGDQIAHEIGVISTPIVTSREIKDREDVFIVVASDGVWDMLENQEVCDFVEAYRQKCQRNLTMPGYMDVVEPNNACIAQLLCEEARARWLSIVEAEDVNIDDISCLIIEMKLHSTPKKKAPPRVTSPRKDIDDVPGLEKGLRKSGTTIKDPVRETINVAEEISGLREDTDTQPTVQIRDPRRSSVSSIRKSIT